MMVKNYGSGVNYVERYKALRKKGMSKDRAARIASLPRASLRGAQNKARETLAK